MLLPADPRANYLAHQAEIDEAIRRVLHHGTYILGEETVSFEREFADFQGCAYSVGVASGTDALSLALRICGIEAGDEVITVSHTAVATIAAIEQCGAMPVLADVDPISFTIDSNMVEDTLKAGRSRVKAVVPVHLYGHPADLPALAGIVERYGVRMVEDCAQSHGASIGGRKTGSWGNAAAFSFYPTKNLGAIGDGGAIVTNSEDLAGKARLLREYGWQERYISKLVGMNSRLDELQAAVLRVKLRYLDQENIRRREIAEVYNSQLSGTPLLLPRVRNHNTHVYHQYVVRSDYRNELRDYLKERLIGTLVHYPVPVHLQPAYRGRLSIGSGGLAQTEKLCEEILSLPMHPQMTNEDAFEVCRVICAYYGKGKA